MNSIGEKKENFKGWLADLKTDVKFQEVSARPIASLILTA